MAIDFEKYKLAIVNLLKNKKRFSQTDIQRETGIHPYRLKEILRDMVDEKTLEKDTNFSGAYSYYTLKQSNLNKV